MNAGSNDELSVKNMGTCLDKGLFAEMLLSWNRNSNFRVMPWKGEKDPYKIWLSEIILQQTRVNQGLKYYENFIRMYPDIHALASASDEEVYKLWEGLGYYSRCRNLLETARCISKNLNGKFPDDYCSILKLKGIGTYTAAAIASFAFNQAHAVVDGNVYRVISRILNIQTPVDTIYGRKEFSTIAQQLLPADKPAEYNQAIMDFGATVCKPVPDCENCFFSANCLSFESGTQLFLPVKEKKIQSRERWFYYFIVSWKNQIYIRQRTTNDIWQYLFEYVLVEGNKTDNQEKILHVFERRFGIHDYKFHHSQNCRQKLTHQVIHFNLIHIELKKEQEISGYFRVKRPDIGKYAFPKTLKKFLTDNLQ